jgi:uncharacterized protein (DUF433 family)
METRSLGWVYQECPFRQRPTPASTPVSNLLDRITIDPAVCHGRPVVRGLRYPVDMLLDLLSGGTTPEEILADYPDLEREDIFAALAYAARLTRVQRIEPLAA